METSGYVYDKHNLKDIELTVTSLDGKKIFASSFLRTILPDSLDGTSLNYYLYYINTLSSSINKYSYYGKVNLSYTSETQATTTVNFEDSVYRFALFACENNYDNPEFAIAQNQACLCAYSIADLRSAKQVVFYLSSTSLSGKGFANVSLSSSWDFPDGWNFESAPYGNSTVTVGIYDVKTGEAVGVNSPNSNVNPHLLSYSSTGEVSSRIHLSNYNFDGCSFDAGSYSFVVRFSNSDYGVNYEYSDLIQILPNQTSSATIDVPDVIELAPNAPGDFLVSITPPEDDKGQFYLADFTWADNANNEVGFEIEIADVSCNRSNLSGQGTVLYIPSVTNDAEWNSTLASTIYSGNTVKKFDSESYNDYILYYYNYFDSADYSPENFSLLRNNDKARFYFQLGKRYIARIRAVNDAGCSSWTYIDFSNTTFSNSVNLFKICYETDSGSQVVYLSQNDGSGVQVTTPDDDLWTAWYVSFISDDSKYPSTNAVCDLYTGHENLVLIGAYTKEIDESYEWCDFDIILYGMDASFGTVYFNELTEDSTGNKRTCSLGQYLDIDKNSVATLKWALSTDGSLSATEIGAAVRYDSVVLDIKKISTLSKIYTQTWNKDLLLMDTQISTWDPGYYLATFTGTKGIYTYSLEIVFKLNN